MRISPQCVLWFDPRWFDLCSGLTPRILSDQHLKKNVHLRTIYSNFFRHYLVCLCLFFLSYYFGCFPIGHKMVKSRITASRRLRAQVKKHQKTRRGGHNGFSPRLRELNSGDVPWEMPSGGKSKFPTHTHTHTHTHKKRTLNETDVAHKQLDVIS